MRNKQNLYSIVLVLTALLFTSPYLLVAQNSFPSSGDALIADSHKLFFSRTTYVSDSGFIRFILPYSNTGWGWPDIHERALVFENNGYNDSSGAGGGGFLFRAKKGDGTKLNAVSIRRDGRVGIGTRQPTDKLTVNGTASAEEIIVEENVGADFVFEECYQLPSLSKVENHIKTKKHLPEIPSAEEMKRYGVKVGDLQMKLLQKIEELTLYVIELEKKDKERQKRMEEQQQRIELLEQKVSQN